jgi:hypothetical protein
MAQYMFPLIDALYIPLTHACSGRVWPERNRLHHAFLRIFQPLAPIWNWLGKFREFLWTFSTAMVLFAHGSYLV